jgi:rhamnulokinase
MDDSLFIAVDLGAGSGRVFVGGVTAGELLLEEIRRFHYPTRESDGHLRWDFAKILREIKAGLRTAGQRARELGRRVQSIGVAGWGVDYGLIDAAGELVENPVCYRDARTQGVMEEVFSRISREELFARTGLQLMPFNTLFQLYAQVQQEGIPRAADRLLLIPDLVHFCLTGRAVTEYTNATTTQMINAQSGTWDLETLTQLNLPTNLLTELVFAGARIGPLCPLLGDELGLENVQIIAPATHDTGSAVAGAPLRSGWAYISSGTWSLVGVERSSVLINAEVSAHNFTNEGGAFGTVRFLKNVTGLWILESCRKEWNERGFHIDYERLLRQIAETDDCRGLIFPDDPRFFNPASMLGAIAEQLAESDQSVPDDPFTLTKVILDSLAFRYASVLRTIESLTEQRLNGVQIVGGGSRNDYLNQMTANATNSPVAAGPVEATVTGNVMVQAIAAKRFTSLAEARLHVAQNICVKRFTPRPSPALAEARRSYDELETRYVH